MNNKQKRRGKLHIAGYLVVLMAGFFFILTGMNAYRYFKIKNHFATQVITRINRGEVEKLRAFFNQVSEKLVIIHDMGASGVLKFTDIVSLNRAFMPLLENQDMVSGVILADNRGQEYFLQRKDGKWVTRLSRAAGRTSRMVFQAWKAPDKPFKKWEEEADYIPGKRPWFHRSKVERQVFWSPVYRFFESGRSGVTASISWERPGSASGFVVFALDVPLEHIQKLLGWKTDGDPASVLFLVNPGGRFFITARQMGSLQASGAEPSANSSAADDSLLISRIFEEWNRDRMQPDKFVEVTFKGQKWLASHMPLSEDKEVYWVGIAAPEKAVLSDLRKALFRVDFSDMAIALMGAGMVLLVLWRADGLKTETEEKTKSSFIRLNDYINEGEGNGVEFKSTVRTNLKTGKRGKEIEFAWLKAVVAFLNSSGGALLIGVDDEGRIVGIGPDNFENADKCLLHLKNVINQHVGAEFSSFIHITLVEVDGKTAVLIECAQANEPVFLRIGKNEEFYIRSGPSSIRLSPSRMISYVLQNMKRRG